MAEVKIPGSIVDAGLSLRIVSTAEAGREGEEIVVGGPLEIGRDAGCPVVLHDSSVSRKHARVEPAAAGLRLIDLDSGNGVWLGGDRIKDVVLAGGERFRIGSTVFECLVAERVNAPAAPPAMAPATGPGRLIVRIIEGGEKDQAGREFTPVGVSMTI